MISFQNYDSSFFQIEVEGFKDPLMKKDISDRIISLEVVEEMGKIATGNIQIYDEDDLRFSNTMKGKKITVKWGYSNMDLSGQQAFRKMNNPKEMWSPTLVNRVMSGRIKNPSGGGDENGTFTFNCSFYGREYLDNSSPIKRFNSGKKADVIAEVFQAMGIQNYHIDFRRQNEVITRDTALMKSESNFRFLARQAQEWRAMFRIATSNKVINPFADPPEYGMVGLFCDYDKDVTVQAFLMDTLGASGDSSTFEYKLSGSPNVKSYTWQHHQGGEGSGDNVRVVVTPSGKTEFYFMKADTEQVKYYKLQTSVMQKELAQKGNVASQAQWVAKMFEEANKGMDNLVEQHYFVEVNSSTAPQGVGLSMTMETIGNPLYTCPARAKFSKGFPDVFMTKKGLTFYQTRVSHKINRSGYTNTIQIADAYTVSGGSLVG